MNQIQETQEKHLAMAKEASEIVNQLRCEFGLSVFDMSEGISVSESTILAWEKLDQVPTVFRLDALRTFRDGHELARSLPSPQRELFPDQYAIDAAFERFGEAWNTVETWDSYIARMEEKEGAGPVVFGSVRRPRTPHYIDHSGETLCKCTGEYHVCDEYGKQDTPPTWQELVREWEAIAMSHAAIANDYASQLSELRERAESAENERDFYKSEYEESQGTIADLSNAATLLTEQLEEKERLDGWSVVSVSNVWRSADPHDGEYLTDYVGFEIEETNYWAEPENVSSFEDKDTAIIIRNSAIKEIGLFSGEPCASPKYTYADQLEAEKREDQDTKETPN